MAKDMNSVFKKISEVMEQVNTNKKEEFIDVAKTTIKQGDVKLHLPSEDLNYDKAVVTKNTEDSNYIVAIPYKVQGKVKETSAATLVFDEEQDFLRYQELIVEEGADSDSVKYRYYVDNEETASGTTPTSESEVSTENWLGCMNTCLANQGLSNWAIGLFAALCAAACGTIILCAACIEGPLLVYSVQITNCLKECGPNS
ncbi:hypothetical protein [Bacillus swezeyi]|uniref:hypothetical protein n=1 Tax=Bacillus swezeyi TaxID=1925020 RepID=UPI001CC249B8|nr:hypothetical protein [Bacillus swezeyi]